jgi:hypothetical protein
VEFVASFGVPTPGGFQHVGFGGGNHSPPGEVYNTSPWAMFSTTSGATPLNARVWGDGSTGNPNAAPLTQPVCSAGLTPAGNPCPCTVDACTNETHTFRVDWGISAAHAADFYIDGVLVVTIDINLINGDTLLGPMRPAISDFQTTAPVVVTDWLRMTPYGSPCAFESQPHDSGAPASVWNTLVDATTLPAGSAASFETRTGDVLPIDGTWSAFAPVAGGVIASPSGRYLQYRASLSSTDANQTPELAQVDVDFSLCTPTGQPETLCNGVDDDCDGLVDEDFVGNATACGVGACSAAGVETCVGGVLGDTCTPGAPAPDDATCDAIDDDCDGTDDEDFVVTPTGCGVGECASTGVTTCVAGVVGDTCTPGTPSAELCDGLDNDCDGAADDGNPESGQVCDTGQAGVCMDGLTDCQAGVLQCVQTVFGGPEVCNNLDDDCNGAVDDGNPGGGGACSTGQPGECDAGTLECQAGNVVCVADNAPTAEICDGLDNDCDASTDEDLGQTTCGVGECEVTTDNCIGGVPQTCTPGAPSAEVCDGLDNDCDAAVDDGLGQTTCGVGECEVTTDNCIGGVEQTCTPGAPGAEVCDGLDNDCDASTDEDLGQTTCGVGECSATTDNCIGGVEQTCTPGSPSAELCDGLDNNCDGTVDDGDPEGGAACLTGQPGECDAGTETCQGGALVCAQNQPAEPEICDNLDNDCDGAIDNDCLSTGCPAVPSVGCFEAERTQFQIRDKADNTKDQLKWKWTRGEATVQADTGDPLNTTTYALCVYDSTAAVPALVASIVVDPNGAWDDKDPKGWKYKDKQGAFDGVQKVQLKTGTAGKSKAQVKAKGSNIPTPAPFNAVEFFDADPNVTVQLVNDEGKCWTTEFATATKNEVDQYKAKSQ